MKAYLEVYGCTANKSDACIIKGVLIEHNHEIVNNINESDVIIINTCTVIDTTEQRMLSRIKSLKKTGKKIVVAGCMASVQREKIKDILTDAHLLPPQYSQHIVDILENKNCVFFEENKTKFPKLYSDISAPISIAEGCNFSCSYCITTFARGKLKSFPTKEIVQDVKNAVEIGCKEIQLTAQDTSSYRPKKNIDLGVLLKEISNIKGDFRVRVGMMNPYTCLKSIDSIINGYSDDKIYKFVHLPVQSGDNDILKKMNRKYYFDNFLKIVKNFRQNYPDISLSTDVIIGFPTETEEQFQHTIDLIETVRPDITNITKFSARPLTAAKKMKGRIKTEIVKKRSKKISNICTRISKEINKDLIGKEYNILISEQGKNKTFVGRAENYKPVVIKEKMNLGEFVKVKIIDSDVTYLVGSII